MSTTKPRRDARSGDLAAEVLAILKPRPPVPYVQYTFGEPGAERFERVPLAEVERQLLAQVRQVAVLKAQAEAQAARGRLKSEAGDRTRAEVLAEYLALPDSKRGRDAASIIARRIDRTSAQVRTHLKRLEELGQIEKRK